MLGCLDRAPAPIKTPLLDIFWGHVEKGTVEVALADAFTYCSALDPTPLGKAAGARTFAAVLKEATEGKHSGTSTMFSGALAQLNLTETALPDNLNIGRVRATLADIRKLSDLRQIVGPIVVNVDSIPATSTDVQDILRANKDAEIAALCCAVHWISQDPAYAVEDVAFVKAGTRDLIFDGRCFGQGAQATCNVLNLVDKEEASRQTLGLSAARTCLLINDLIEQLHREDPRCIESSHVAKAFKENGISSKWSAETIKRYWGLGKQLRHDCVLKALNTYEYFYGRESLLDSISNLRFLVGATDTPEELALLMRLVFLDHRSGMRTNLGNFKGETRWYFHAMLLRATLQSYLKTRFPKLTRGGLVIDCRYFKHCVRSFV